MSMRVRRLLLEDFRPFPGVDIELDQLNVFIGANNAGKTSILKALRGFQQGIQIGEADVRHGGSGTCRVAIEVEGNASPDTVSRWQLEQQERYRRGKKSIQIGHPNPGGNKVEVVQQEGGRVSGDQLLDTAPMNWIVPFHGARKVDYFDESVSESNLQRSSGDYRYLPAKISSIDRSGHPGQEAFKELCTEILGRPVTVRSSANGLVPAVFVEGGASRPLTEMGHGVTHIAAFLCELVVAENKLFLIEEPENDLHPRALKRLLDVIVDRSTSNQFVVTTHSSIVATHLGAAAKSKLFHVTREHQNFSQSAVQEIPPEPQARIDVLQELGYELADLYMGNGWIIFEESSAERLVRDYLIPWFAPKLGRLNTLAANGAGDLGKRFSALNQLVLFAHLDHAYRKNCWVIADGDEAGSDAIDRLRHKFGTTWGEDRFKTFSRPNLEDYFPTRFGWDADKSDRAKKSELLNQVLEACESDPESVRAEFEVSAAEVIELLQVIEREGSPAPMPA